MIHETQRGSVERRLANQMVRARSRRGMYRGGRPNVAAGLLENRRRRSGKRLR
jgi:hypothetical protein